MYKLSYDDLHFEWKDEALAVHGDINHKEYHQLYGSNMKHSVGKTMTDKAEIKDCVWGTIKDGFPSDCKSEKDKKIYLLNLMDTKLLYKEIIDFTIDYLNETIKY